MYKASDNQSFTAPHFSNPIIQRKISVRINIINTSAEESFFSSNNETC